MHTAGAMSMGCLRNLYCFYLAGSKNGNIRIDGLQADHAEILHVPEMVRADGSKAAARVSVLLYGGMCLLCCLFPYALLLSCLAAMFEE